jgi:hypothetical protein
VQQSSARTTVTELEHPFEFVAVTVYVPGAIPELEFDVGSSGKGQMYK